MENQYPARLLSIKELAKKVKEVRQGGAKIILANGCFDLIHAGHVRYLAGAKALGGFLVVAINSDRQVTYLKGDGRPYIPENERAEIMCSFRFVDAVTVFDESTVDRIIEAIRPDIHAKGTDYSVDSVPERETVKKYGGRVAIVGDPKDHSSTDLLMKISKFSG